MGNPASKPQPVRRRSGAENRLESWKAIAAYLNRDTRTVQRWEKTEGLPVHRQQHDKLASVFAYASELDEWRERRQSIGLPAPLPTNVATESCPARRILAGSAVGISAVVALLGGWLLTRNPQQTLRPERAPVPLTSYSGDELSASFSPDGRQVAFCWNGDNGENFDIYAQVIGAGKPLRLTTDPAVDSSPAWSPDGKWIAFLRASPEHVSSVMVVPALGGEERRLVSTNREIWSWYRSLDWSPDGKWLAFADRAGPHDPLALFLLSVETGEKRQITKPIAQQDEFQPAFSPDGKSLVFVRDQGGSAKLNLLRLRTDMTPDGVPEQISIAGFDGLNCASPQWTADGRVLIFSANKGGMRRLWRVPLPAQRGTAIAEPLGWLGEGAFLPALSREGERLSFTRSIPNKNIWSLALLANKGAPRRLIASTRSEQYPQFSPDGKRVAFESDRSGSPEIWTSDPDGNNATQHTALGGPVTGSPSWSPDGKRIAFDSRADGQPDIYTLAVAARGKPARVTNDPARDVVPAWSKDGRSIYFASDRSGTFQIWRVGAEGGEAKQITREGGWGPVLSADGEYIYYLKSRGANTAIWQVPRDGGPETPVFGGVFDRSFTVNQQGIFYISRSDQQMPTIRFFRLADRKDTFVAKLEGRVEAGLALSPDGRSLLFTRLDEGGGDLMLVENFR